MTAPTPDPTRLDEARVKLHAALVEVMAAIDWPAERARLLPPWQPVPPIGWVDVPTMAPGPQGTVMATFPVAVAVDGAERRQVEQADRLLAYGWDTFPRVEVGGQRASVLTAGPQFLETGAGETRAVVFSVQVPLLTRTLCSGTITVSNPASNP